MVAGDVVAASAETWVLTNHFDPTVAALADRHYSRKKPGTRQFTPPGRKLVLVSACGRAGWVTSWPRPEFVRHAWPTAWLCSFFRNEGAGLSSALIREAVAASRWKWAEVPEIGMITFINTRKIRRKRDPGRCFRRAGFTPAGETKSGLPVLQLQPADMPEPLVPLPGPLLRGI